MAVVGVSRADDLYPLFPNPIFERFHAYLVFAENLLENYIHVHGIPHDGAEVLWDASQVGYEILRLAGKLVRLVCHELVRIGNALRSVEGIRRVEADLMNSSAAGYQKSILNRTFPGLPG